jgi:hypothetical protein
MMNPAQKVLAFAAGLAVVFAVAAWVGKAVAPEDGSDVRQTPAHSAHDSGAPEPLGGLASVQDGYTSIWWTTAPRPARMCRCDSGSSTAVARQ